MWLRWGDGAARAVRTAHPTRRVVGGPFDAVFLLNVLDRTTDPAQLLAAAADLVHPGAVAVIALALPQQGPPPFAHPRPPGDSNGTWAAAAQSLLLWLGRLGWEPLTLSRAPYLTSGDGTACRKCADRFAWDLAVVVCRLRA
eukprot:gene20744-8450_t